jgi:hypothetical protein
VRPDDGASGAPNISVTRMRVLIGRLFSQIIHHKMIVILCLLSTLSVFSFRNPKSIHYRSFFHQAASTLSRTSTTYIPFSIGIDEKETLLVKSDEDEIISLMRSLDMNGEVSITKLTKWIEQGKVFKLTDDGTNALVAKEQDRLRDVTTFKREKRLHSSIDTYINIASNVKKESKLIKSSKATDYYSGLKDFKDLEQRGEAFTNLTELFVDHRVLSRANSIAQRLVNDFAVSSPEWRRYTNKTMEYNATSLTEVIIAVCIYVDIH